ncbi:hypothetical protein PM082_004917 [Marasmius tenuissimus]|nr:hypothetical protein PM082_004917 [Marasmius tenuissimus]
MMGLKRFINLKVLSLLELVIHGICIAISAVATGFSAQNIYETEFFFDDTLNFTPLVLAIASTTIILLSLSLILTVFRRQPFLTRISVELIWSGFLWIAWFATGGYVSYSDTCPYPWLREYIEAQKTGSENDDFIRVCRVHTTLTSVSFVVGTLLFVHWIVLLVVGHKVSDGSQRTWNMSLKEIALRASSLTATRIDTLQETNKFEYDQPAVTAFPPDYIHPHPTHLSTSHPLSPTLPSTPSPAYSPDSPIEPSSMFNLIHPGSFYGQGGWHRPQDLPDGYEVSSESGTLPIALRRESARFSTTEGSHDHSKIITDTPPSPTTRSSSD